MLFLVSCVGRLDADFAAGVKAYENKDYAAAAKEWREAADSGNAAAQFNLGLLYLDGKGVPQNDTEAANLFRRSADQGYLKAQYNLGELYAIGQGIRRDYVSAHMWLNLCAAQGDAKCAAHRDLLARKMRPRDLAAAQRRATDWRPAPAPAPAQ